MAFLLGFTEVNPGGYSYTLNDKLENQFPIPKLPSFTTLETVDASDTIFNLFSLFEFAFILRTLIPLGVLVVIYYVLFLGPFPENLFTYKWIVFVYTIYSEIAPIFFWLYLKLQKSTMLYKAIWIVFPASFFGFFIDISSQIHQRKK